MAHKVDGTVSGAVPTTPDVERTAIQVIGAHPSFELLSSFFLMVFDEPHHTRKGGNIGYKLAERLGGAIALGPCCRVWRNPPTISRAAAMPTTSIA